MAVGKKYGGRQKGTPNKITGQLRDMILQALDEQPGGAIEYLKIQAAENPNAFMGLLGKILPTQLTGADGGPIQSQTANVTPEQLAEAVQSVKDKF